MIGSPVAPGSNQYRGSRHIPDEKGRERSLVVGLLVGFVLLSSSLRCGQHAPAEKSSKVPGRITKITSTKQFERTLAGAGGTLMIFDLYADWCGPCKVLSPVLDSIAERYHTRTNFYKVNIDELPSVSREFRTTGIPYVVFVKGGRIVQTFVGVQPREAYEQAIEQHAAGS